MAKTFEERQANLAPARDKYNAAIKDAEDKWNAGGSRKDFDAANATALSEWNAAVVAEG